MRSLLAFFINRPVFVSMFFIVLMVVGLVGYSRMGTNLMPSVEIPVVTVSIVYPGAGPEEVENSVTNKVEDALSGVSDLDYINSSSQENVSIVSCNFIVGIDVNVALQNVREKVLGIRGALPDDAQEPVVSKIDFNQMPVLTYAVSSDKRGIREVRDLVDNVIQDKLLQIAGVAAANVSGGQQREIQISVDSGRLTAYGLNINQLVQQLKAENLNIPSGRIDQARKEFTVRVMGEFGSPADIGQMAIQVGEGAVILLSDVAEVRDASQEVRSFSRLNGNPAVQLSIVKASDANTVEVARAVRERIDNMTTGELPKDISFTLVDDTAKFAEEAVHDVIVTILLGALIATLVVWTFLGSFRSTLIVFTVLPVTIISTFAFMYALGFTLNILSMLALSIAVGFLVDDAIVMIENIYRHVQNKQKTKSGALSGSREIIAAVIATSLTTLAVFVPIGFMSGIVGQFFREFGLTVAAAVIISTVAAASLTPMMAGNLLRLSDVQEGGGSRLRKGFDHWFDSIRDGYGKVIELALARPWLTLLLALGLFIVSLLPAKFLGGEFQPQQDEGKFYMLIELPTGAQLATTDAVSIQIEQRLKTFDEVQDVMATVGSGGGSMFGGSSSGAEMASISIILKDKHKPSWQYVQEVRQWATDYPGTHIYAALDSSSREDAPLQVQLHGQELAQLTDYANQLAKGLAAIPGAVDVDTSMKPGKPELRVQIDRMKAAHFGLPVAQISSVVRTALAGTDAGVYREAGNEYNMLVRLRETDRATREQLESLKIPNMQGHMVPLSSVATVTVGTGPTQIRHRDQGRIVVVRGSVAQGFFPLNVQGLFQKEVVDKVSFAPGYGLGFEGEATMIRDALSNIGVALILAVIFVFATLSAQFESLRTPFVIMFSLPLAISGVIWALLLAGKSLNIISAIGVVMLMGLVTKNAILMLDYAGVLQGRGLPVKEALIEAGKTRFRPIMMTAATLIFALIPTALALGKGSELRSPMAVGVIGGYITSTLLTLVVVPVIYSKIGGKPPQTVHEIED